MSVDLVTGGGTAARTISVAKSIRNDFNKECIVIATDQGLSKKNIYEINDSNMMLLHSIVDRFYIPYFSFTKLAPAYIPLEDISRPAKTISLTALAFAPGVLNTTIPFSEHSATGTLL